jgi:hypothetical protein
MRTSVTLSLQESGLNPAHPPKERSVSRVNYSYTRADQFGPACLSCQVYDLYH